MWYNHNEIEKKWQKYWEENKIFKTLNPKDEGFDDKKPKYYVLDMFPYPSWAWLHVGHPEWYTANDIIARYKKANGYNVLHPMWWDAFWLPAENYAIKTWTHPKITTEKNIDNFRKQIKALWISYDWDREINTTEPSYYKWTQWIFLKMFENGLAYEQDLPINYCPSCKTWLANEEVLSDHTCERCGTKVEKKKIRQWVLAITKYADRLLKDVDKLDWPEGIKEMQRNWIWKSEGCEFRMNVVFWNEKFDTKKNKNYRSQRVGHNVLAKFLFFIENNQKEKKIKWILKNNKLSSLYFKKVTEKWTIIFNWKNIFKHFSSKNNKEIRKRSKFANIIYSNLENIYFIEHNVWILIYKNFVLKIILWEQSNWNYFVKTYYIDDKLTELYKYYKNQILGQISVYTTRVDTVFGMTYAVLAPDHKDVDKFITKEYEKQCKEYIEESKSKSDQDRTQDDKEKTWVFTGSYVINPFNWKKVPLWIWDYVLWNYGTWAVMAVPSHDERDFEFAKKYNLEIKQSIKPKKWEYKEPFTEDWILVDSWEFSWLDSKTAREKLTKYAEEKWFGKNKINYKLRDWLFSRQRYWGEPIPLIHLNEEDLKKLPKINSLEQATEKNKAYIFEKNNWEKELIIDKKVFSKIYDGVVWKIVCDYNLPLELPEVERYEPAGDGQSPLANIDSFVNIKLADNLTWKRETNTMPQWWGSCWYYLRYMDPHNDKELVNPEIEKYWNQVDSYVWGAEHAVLHLLYARFWHKFLYDINVVSTDEPFYRLKNQGLILSYAFERKNGWLVSVDLVEEKKDWEDNIKYFHKETGEELKKVIAKMSKSLKNVVNPDDIIKEYGADALRLYEMYLSDFKDSAPWDTKWIIWVVRFLEKIAKYFIENETKIAKDDEEAIRLLHKSIKKISNDIENYKFNTAIAQLMILLNYGIPKDKKLEIIWKENFVKLLHPFAPHIAEEIYHILDLENKKESIFFETWPKYDEKLAEDSLINIAVQVMWKLRWTIQISKDTWKDEVLKLAKDDENVKKWIDGKTIIKEIYVPWKIVNLVVK